MIFVTTLVILLSDWIRLDQNAAWFGLFHNSFCSEQFRNCHPFCSWQKLSVIDIGESQNFKKIGEPVFTSRQSLSWCWMFRLCRAWHVVSVVHRLFVELCWAIFFAATTWVVQPLRANSNAFVLTTSTTWLDPYAMGPLSPTPYNLL